MQTRGLTPNVIIYSAVISACEKGRECQEAPLQMLLLIINYFSMQERT